MRWAEAAFPLHKIDWNLCKWTERENNSCSVACVTHATCALLVGLMLQNQIELHMIQSQQVGEGSQQVKASRWKPAGGKWYRVVFMNMNRYFHVVASCILYCRTPQDRIDFTGPPQRFHFYFIAAASTPLRFHIDITSLFHIRFSCASRVHLIRFSHKVLSRLLETRPQGSQDFCELLRLSETWLKQWKYMCAKHWKGTEISHDLVSGSLDNWAWVLIFNIGRLKQNSPAHEPLGVIAFSDAKARGKL